MYPFINIFEYKISSYGLCMVLAILLVTTLSIKKASKKGVKSEDIIILSAVSVGFALFGAFFLYILVTYSTEEIFAYLQNGDLSFLKSGGLVFYGGLIGGIFGALLTVRMLKLNFSKIEGSVVPYIPMGHAIGRIGCLLAGCCYGIDYKGAFAVFYSRSVAGISPDIGHFPVQALEAVMDVCITVLLLYLSKKKLKKFDILFTYLFTYATVRFCMEFLRGDIVRGIYHGFSTGQWISLILVAVCSIRFIIINYLNIKKHR